MADTPVDVSQTFLTERQAEVLSMREDGLTQAAIADELGTSVPNVSAVERSARENVAAARRTVTLARLLGARSRFAVEAGTDLRELVDRVYAAADAVDVRVPHTDPELTALLHDQLGDRLDGRQVTAPVRVGVAADGSVVTFPAAVAEEPADEAP